MTRNKPAAKKKRLSSAAKKSVAAPFWVILRKFGKKKTHRWRINPQMRRSWKRRRIKA